MFTAILMITTGGLIWWLAIYILTKNISDILSRLIATFLISLSVYLSSNYISQTVESYQLYQLIWRLGEWSYIVPIPMIYHIALAITKKHTRGTRLLLTSLYFFAGMLIILTYTTNLVVDKSVVHNLVQGYGYSNPRGNLFWLLYVIIVLANLFSIIAYCRAIKSESNNRWKYYLAVCTPVLYLFSGPTVVALYYMDDITFAAKYSTLLLVAPLLPTVVSVIKFKLIPDLADIINYEEFRYTTMATLVVLFVYASSIVWIVNLLGEYSSLFIVILTYTVIITHTFYDWLTTFIRDLAYNPKKGFSIITDTDTQYIIANFHNPERLESSPIMKFNRVKKSTSSPVDTAQDMIREAIEYFKQPDYPRRTKQNLKYQILRMTTFDEADEGQILWELGFEGYPMKIMSGEDTTRKPLFKIEAMSDYTAISRNAFIALKKEAIHDLTWRLSYLEKTSK